jgi:hypothetical protein
MLASVRVRNVVRVIVTNVLRVIARNVASAVISQRGLSAVSAVRIHLRLSANVGNVLKAISKVAEVTCGPS